MSYLQGFERDILPYVETGRRALAHESPLDNINSIVALADFIKHVEQVRSGETSLD